MNVGGAVFTIVLGLAMCGLAALIEILDRRGWIARKLELVEKVKAAKEAVRQGTATEEQRRLDQEWSENRTLNLNPAEFVTEAIRDWLLSNRFGRVLIELWLLVQGLLLFTGVPGVLHGDDKVLGYQVLVWWFVGFWPAVGLFGATLVIPLILVMNLSEQVAKLRRRDLSWRRFLRIGSILTAMTAVLVAFAAWLGWLTWLINLFPAAWNHLRHLPT
jgi:hypothetical protein